MNEDIKERGAAEMIVDLHNGVITVRHGEANHPILAQWTANRGDWDKIWETINTLKANEKSFTEELEAHKDNAFKENIS